MRFALLPAIFLTAALAALAALVALVALAGEVAADSSVPAPPRNRGVADWRGRCAERLRGALRELTREEPDFAGGTVSVDKEAHGGVRFEAMVPDHEHARFYAGAPAHYVVRIVEKVSKEPGELGSELGSAADSQASLALTRSTRERQAVLDVQVANGRQVFRFSHWFKPAADDCLR